MNKFILVLAISAFVVSVRCSNCIGAQIYDSAKNTCLSSKSDCIGFISSDQLNCVTECQLNESVYEHVEEGQVQFKQCFFCEGKSVFNYNKSTQFYTCNNRCFKSYETPDINKVCGCNKKIIFDMSNYSYQCSDSCIQEQFFMEKNLQIGMYQCASQCSQGYVQVGDSQTCIHMSECTTYVYNNKCQSSCSNLFIYDKENNQNYQKCDSYCNYYSYFPDETTKLCVKDCPEGYYKTNDSCILKEQCTKGYISYDGTKCLNYCNENTYPVAITENLFKCEICYKYYLYQNMSKDDKLAQIRNLQKINMNDVNNKSDIPQCVDSCPPGYIEISYQTKTCVQLEQCQLLNSERTKCVNYCIYPEILINKVCMNPCKDKPSDCVPECGKGYYKQPNDQGFECVQVCPYYISTDQKHCVQNCNVLNELNSNNDNNCQACKSNEIIQYDSNSNRYECISANSRTLDEQLKNFDITVETDGNDFLAVKNNKEKVKYFYQQIISQKDTTSIIEQLQYLVEISEKIMAQNNSQNISIENSDKSFLLKHEFPKNGYQYKTAFDISQFHSDSSYSQFEPTTNVVQYNLQTRNVYSILSLKNPFCNSDKCKFSKLFFTKVHAPLIRNLQQLGDSLPYQVTFPVDKSISEVNKLICVSYNNFGEMISNLEWTKFNQDKTSVTCSYSTNTALYIDSTCLFINSSLCPKIVEQKPQEELPQKQQEEGDDGDISLSGGAIAGIVIGCVFGTLIIAFVVYKLLISSKLKSNLKVPRNLDIINPELNKQV